MKIKVALLSAGLGNVSRGFEISAATWYEMLKNDPSLDVDLYSGGAYPTSTTVWNVSRNGFISAMLRKFHVIKDGCRLEQMSFAVGFLLQLIRKKTDIIWVQEISLAQQLLKLKNTFKFRYKIVFCDGAPVGHQLAKSFDHIVFLHEYARLDALKDGLPQPMLSTIPHVTFVPQVYTKKDIARAHFHIPDAHFVILCVAAWNTHHKRIHYLIEETAQLIEACNQPLTLFLCGQAEKETTALQALAVKLQVPTIWKTLSPSELNIAYDCADVFVLPSLSEGLGAVLIEASFHKLPVICHAHDAAKFIFGEEYEGLENLSIDGNLAKKLHQYQSLDLSLLGLETEMRVHKNFAPDKLRDDFVSMIQSVFHS